MISWKSYEREVLLFTHLIDQKWQKKRKGPLPPERSPYKELSASFKWRRWKTSPIIPHKNWQHRRPYATRTLSSTCSAQNKSERSFRRPRTPGSHSARDLSYSVDKLHGNSSEEKRKATHSLGPQGPSEPCHPARALPTPNHWRHCHLATWHESLHKAHVRNGFWHWALDEDSSFLATFHTFFGRYRWRRLAFGIDSAPEVFQRKMHELKEGLWGIEVVADDFIAIGCGSTVEKATIDHDKVLMPFLEGCKGQGVKLNTDKLNPRMTKNLVHRTHCYGQRAKCWPSQGSDDQRNASSNRQSWGSGTVGACAVSHQVPPLTVGYYKAYERADAEQRTMDLGYSPRSVIRSTEESYTYTYIHTFILRPQGAFQWNIQHTIK